MTERPRGLTVYVDANPFMHALEGSEELAAALKNLFSVFQQRPGTAVTSELTLAEVLPKKKVPDRQFLELLIWSKIFDLRTITREILIETADYRRIAGTKQSNGRVTIPKLPDAIHVVTAIHSGCDVFLSNDLRIKLPVTMKLIEADVAGVTALMQEFA